MLVNNNQGPVGIEKHPSRLLLLCLITFNAALFIVRIGIASYLRNDYYTSTVESFMIESALLSCMIGLASCWMAYVHTIRWRLSTHDASHALNILAFIFTVYSLAYAAKEIKLDNFAGKDRALAALSIIQCFFQMIQLMMVSGLVDGLRIPIHTAGPVAAPGVGANNRKSNVPDVHDQPPISSAAANDPNFAKGPSPGYYPQVNIADSSNPSAQKGQA